MAELRAADGIGEMAARSIQDWKSLVEVDAELERIAEGGVELVCLEDETYPVSLRAAPNPPPLLYCRGALSPMDEAAVAVIGTRRMSRYGRTITHDFADSLARAGMTVVSGLALGVDSEAHRAALDAGGRTIAVLGNGLSSVYPAQHRRLAEEIVANGALISEMPMNATPDAGSFPQRNSIIAGLSLGVLVTEAGARSGTTITVGHALEANRSVYAVPGDLNRANSVGTNRMIQEGARLVTCARDILLDLKENLSQLLTGLPDLREPDEEPLPALPSGLTDLEKRVLEALELDPLPIDDLADALAKDEEAKPPAMGELMAALLNLEMRQLVTQEPGKVFRKGR